MTFSLFDVPYMIHWELINDHILDTSICIQNQRIKNTDIFHFACAYFA